MVVVSRTAVDQVGRTVAAGQVNHIAEVGLVNRTVGAQAVHTEVDKVDRNLEVVLAQAEDSLKADHTMVVVRVELAFVVDHNPMAVVHIQLVADHMATRTTLAFKVIRSPLVTDHIPQAVRSPFAAADYSPLVGRIPLVARAVHIPSPLAAQIPFEELG